MPEINLLQGSGRTTSSGSVTRVTLNIIGIVLVLAVAIGGGYFHLQVKKVSADDAATVAQQSSVEQSVASDKNHENFLASQATLAATTQLFGDHLGWASLIPDFSDATLKTASFNSFQATANGGLNVSGTVPTFNDLDKMMQGFQLQSFSTLVSSVSLLNIGLDHSAAGNRVAFTVHVQFNPATLKYGSQ